MRVTQLSGQPPRRLAVFGPSARELKVEALVPGTRLRSGASGEEGLQDVGSCKRYPNSRVATRSRYLVEMDPPFEAQRGTLLMAAFAT